MLSLSDERRLHDGGVSVHHDHAVQGLWYGEPFLQDGVLAYFDGTAVRLCGAPLEGEPAASADTVLRLVSEWGGRPEVEEVAWTGPMAMDLAALAAQGYRCLEVRGGHAISAEVCLDCTNAGPPARRRVRGWHRRRLAARHLRGGRSTALQLRLIERFLRARGIHKNEPDATLAIPALLAQPEVHIIEAWSDAGLCGLVALHKPFRAIAVALLIAHDDETPGTCDFLYGEMIDCARTLGAAAVNVGSSPSEGVYAFKRKWGGRPAVPAYHRCRWTRGRLLRRRHTTWAARLLGVR